MAQNEKRPPEGWDKPENQSKIRQKDMDATWTKKNDQSFFGYEDPVKVGTESKLIIDYEVTTVSVHDSQVFKRLITIADQGATVWVDSAYAGLEYQVHSILNKVEYDAHEKAQRKSPLTDAQKAENWERSRIRARVEHVFGFMENSMNRMTLRTIGVKRTSLSIALMNLVYNIFRYEQLARA